MKHDYPIAFLECWAAYPRREPDNSKKLAWKSWQARVNEGELIADLLAATKGYAASIRQRRLEGTDRVLQAATFYGPNERFQSYLPKPEQQPTARNAAPRPADPDEPLPEAAIARLPPALRSLLAKLTQAKALS